MANTPNQTEWLYAIRSLQRVTRAKDNEAQDYKQTASSTESVIERATSMSAYNALRAQRDVLLKVIAYMAENDPPPDSAAILEALDAANAAPVVTTAPENFDALFDLARGRRPCSACGELLMIGHTVCFSPKCLADTEARERAALDRLCTCEVRGNYRRAATGALVDLGTEIVRTDARHARGCPAFTAFYCCPSCPGLQDQHSMDACYQVGRSKHGRCECGEDLEHFPGANGGGVLCPSCDEEHVGELRELNERCQHVWSAAELGPGRICILCHRQDHVATDDLDHGPLTDPDLDDDDDDQSDDDRCLDCHRVHCTDADDESCEEAKAERDESEREWELDSLIVKAVRHSEP